jgi:hypothetical protein
MRGEGPVRPEGRKQVISHPSRDGQRPSQTGERTGAVRIRVVRTWSPIRWDGEDELAGRLRSRCPKRVHNCEGREPSQVGKTEQSAWARAAMLNG